MKNNNFLASMFDAISDTLNGAERSILDFVSIFVPWAVPIIPAYLTFFHTRDMMNFPPWVAWTAAFVVEALGITAVSTAIRFWKNNTLYKSQQEKAPFWLAVGVYVIYIVIVLTVNVLLEITAGSRSGIVILAIGLFCLLSLPSGVLISIRAQFREQLEDREIRRQERKQERGHLGIPIMRYNKIIKHGQLSALPGVTEADRNNGDKFHG
jgi:hypothetical protein